MKCPKCGEELIVRMKPVGVEPDGTQVYNTFAMCRNCKKKWNMDKKKERDLEQAIKETEPVTMETRQMMEMSELARLQRSSEQPVKIQVEEGTPDKKYSNIPPKAVREKREAEIKKNYGYMLQQARQAETEVKEKSVVVKKITGVVAYILLIGVLSVGAFFVFEKIDLVGKLQNVFNSEEQKSPGVITQESSGDLGSGESTEQ